MHVRNQHTLNLVDLWRGHMLTRIYKMLNLAEQPGAPLCCTSYHHRVGTGNRQHCSGFFRCGDITVGDQRYFHFRFNRRDGVVFRISSVSTCSGPTMYCQRLNTAVFGYARNIDRITVRLIHPVRILRVTGTLTEAATAL